MASCILPRKDRRIRHMPIKTISKNPIVTNRSKMDWCSCMDWLKNCEYISSIEDYKYCPFCGHELVRVDIEHKTWIGEKRKDG